LWTLGTPCSVSAQVNTRGPSFPAHGQISRMRVGVARPTRHSFDVSRSRRRRASRGAAGAARARRWRIPKCAADRDKSTCVTATQSVRCLHTPALLSAGPDVGFRSRFERAVDPLARAARDGSQRHRRRCVNELERVRRQVHRSPAIDKVWRDGTRPACQRPQWRPGRTCRRPMTRCRRSRRRRAPMTLRWWAYKAVGFRCTWCPDTPSQTGHCGDHRRRRGLRRQIGCGGHRCAGHVTAMRWSGSVRGRSKARI
jgi:hypothetical protein